MKLRNELGQRAIARECAEWIRTHAVFKSNTTQERMSGFMNVDDKNYMPLHDLFSSFLSIFCEKERTKGTF